jgi:hypothetical protein
MWNHIKLVMEDQQKKKPFYSKYYFFCDLKFHAKFHNPRATPSGKKVFGTEQKNNPKNSGHSVPQQRLRAAHALHLDKNTCKSGVL